MSRAWWQPPLQLGASRCLLQQGPAPTPNVAKQMAEFVTGCLQGSRP